MLDKRRSRDEDERDIAQAWNIANFVKAAKLPDLTQLLKKRRALTTRQVSPSVGHQRVHLQMLAEFLGKPLRKTRLRKRAPNT